MKEKIKKYMYTPKELALLDYMESEKDYPESYFTDMGLCVGKLFSRGVIDPGKDSGTYRKGSFFGRLEIFSTEEYESYSLLPKEWKETLDDEYFQEYVGWFADNENPRPTEDEILPIDDVLKFIDEKQETPYLANCDCRSLKQGCDAPRNVCITYRTRPGSYVSRGLAKPITKEEAKAVVMRAEEEGLIHTVNPGGICSCCTDCCYLFRAARVRNSQGIWPKVSYRVGFDQEKCKGCGTCADRCRFGVFTEITGAVVLENKDSCQGCGLCVSKCPAGALHMEKVETDE